MTEFIPKYQHNLLKKIEERERERNMKKINLQETYRMDNGNRTKMLIAIAIAIFSYLY